MATLDVRSGSLKRSLAVRFSLNDALWPNISELTRTSAQYPQAGGHWFEPSIAHLGNPR
jgi:hypothetical protein